MEYTIETGLNRNGKCVIAMSPNLYNMLIDQCDFIISQAVESAKKSGDPKLIAGIAKELCAIALVAQQKPYDLNAN